MATTTNLKFRKPHMTNVDGYFYMFDEDTEMLLAKTDDGSTAFSYPFDTLISETIVSAEHDGINYWTLEPSTNTGEMVIRRWRIVNYLCEQMESFTLSSPSHTFDSEAFTVEHYHCTISGSYAAGATQITLSADMPGTLSTGMEVTLVSDSSNETIQVQDVSGNVITLADATEDAYEDGDTLLFYNYIWLFNDASGTDTSTGALYKINAYSGSVMTYTSSGAYSSIKACTFYEISHFTDYGTVNSLMYVKASNLLFININDSSLSYYGSMAMDTIEDDDVTIIEVYDISVLEKNLYRLQKEATYYGETSTWSQYSYQPATFNTMVASISLVASPNVLAANGISTSTLTARVRDQFGQPVEARLVYFEDDDDDGSVTGTTGINTDEDGEATAVYTSGLSARLVTITATVNQS